MSLEVGTAGEIKATAVPLLPVTFVSNDESVATVDSTGIVHGISDGTTIIEVSASHVTKKVEVTVYKTKIEITPLTMSLKPNEMETFTVKVTPEQPYTLKSNNPLIANVLYDGTTVIAHAVGKTQIVVSAGNSSETLGVLVVEPDQPIIKIEPEYLFLTVGEQGKLDVSVNGGSRNLLKNSHLSSSISVGQGNANTPFSIEILSENGVEYRRIRRIQTDLRPDYFRAVSTLQMSNLTESIIGKRITISYRARASHAISTQNATIYVALPENSLLNPTINLTTQWKTYSFTVDVPNVATLTTLRAMPNQFLLTDGMVESFYLDFGWYKVEIGENSNPEWTPAWEDYNPPITMTSDNTEVATVDGAGNVNAIADGVTQIVVGDGTYSQSALVRVHDLGHTEDDDIDTDIDNELDYIQEMGNTIQEVVRNSGLYALETALVEFVCKTDYGQYRFRIIGDGRNDWSNDWNILHVMRNEVLQALPDKNSAWFVSHGNNEVVIAVQ